MSIPPDTRIPTDVERYDGNVDIADSNVTRSQESDIFMDGTTQKIENRLSVVGIFQIQTDFFPTLQVERK